MGEKQKKEKRNNTKDMRKSMKRSRYIKSMFLHLLLMLTFLLMKNSRDTMSFRAQCRIYIIVNTKIKGYSLGNN